jgi:hypothetical protein
MPQTATAAPKPAGASTTGSGDPSAMALHATPHASSALACMVASAWQRVFQLQCRTVLSTLAAPPRPGELPKADDLQPAVRYLGGVLDICGQSSESMFGLLRAQIRGEHAMVAALAEEALRDFALASSDAAQIARATVTTSLDLANELAKAAASAATPEHPP